MSDETMTADDLWEQYRSNEEDAKKAEAEDLIPTGTYEGQGVDYTLSVGDREGGLYYGKPMARLRTELYDVQGRTRPLFFNVSSASSRLCIFRTMPFRFSRRSTTSSCTPSSVEYSCSTPVILTSVAAKPGIEDSKVRRSALPSVWP